MPTDSSAIRGVLIERPQVHADGRGRFSELYRAASMPHGFAQSNHSRSAPGVLRGLHYHRHQDDLWYVVRGRAQVALADLRVPGPDPLVETHVLDGEQPVTIYIPRGVAHGYLALGELDLIYWVTAEYDPTDELGVAWDDPSLGIPWQLDAPPVLSDRDAANPALEWERIPSFA
ncbi:MAG TPA: dTDP-4-dehydrorhamnose 3,5-epimerase family protein [Gaiellales bacterium]|jgi:dTDP-4-dehydrorhamnose 3,5-epimerase|nr:dTDP-4-dehydrorhamnose 3,5-epimerase family protein [Gaiellales bacterium]